jgi:hypothetical protein
MADLTPSTTLHRFASATKSPQFLPLSSSIIVDIDAFTMMEPSAAISSGHYLCRHGRPLTFNNPLPSTIGIHRRGRCDQMDSIHPIIAINRPILHADDQRLETGCHW